MPPLSQGKRASHAVFSARVTRKSEQLKCYCQQVATFYESVRRSRAPNSLHILYTVQLSQFFFFSAFPMLPVTFLAYAVVNCSVK